MKKLISIFVIATALSTAPAWANHEGHNHNHEATSESSAMPSIDGVACKDVAHIKVNGLICDFCARALEKVFGERSEVAGIKVDLDGGMVTVGMKPGMTIDKETLTKLIKDSGYDVTGIHKGC